MKPYYYTDPLAAAWMNIKFGMRYKVYSPLNDGYLEPEIWDWSWEIKNQHYLNQSAITITSQS